MLSGRNQNVDLEGKLVSLVLWKRIYPFFPK